MKISNTMDGNRTSVGLPSWRVLASIVAKVTAVPIPAALVAGFIWGVGPGYATGGALMVAFTVALCIQYTMRASALTAQRGRTIRLERAAATASRALLKRDVADPVGSALGALLEGVDVDSVFLETNTDQDEDERGNVQTVRDILYPNGSDGGPGRWELTGWRLGADARISLGAGDPFTLDLRRLDSLTSAFYRASRIGTEVLLPITAEGTWVGSLGFTAHDASRQWTDGETQLLRFAAEMIGAYWERRDAKARLEELLAAKDEFIASVSHEVRTPLTAVLGFAHELDEDIEKFSDEERSDLIGLIASQSAEVANIVDDLLTAARAQAGTIVIVPEAVVVRELVGDVLSSHSGRVDFLMPGESDLQAWADPGRVRQIMRNLLTNADRYGGGIVKINATASEAAVKIEVRDNGEGIPPHLRDHVFEPYARAHRGGTQPASVGLGLSVARKLAQLMGGNLELSRDDGWTVFTLTLAPHRSDVGSKQPVGTF